MKQEYSQEVIGQMQDAIKANFGCDSTFLGTELVDHAGIMNQTVAIFEVSHGKSKKCYVYKWDRENKTDYVTVMEHLPKVDSALKAMQLWLHSLTQELKKELRGQ